MALEMPCATWNRAPMGRLMPCTMVTEALLKAMPASRAARDISSLASTFPPSWKATGRYLKILCTAERANTSVSGCAFTEVKDSTAWVRASRPVAAVVLGGAVIVN